MTAARIQIGRVRMKNGGADVRVLRRPSHPSAMARHMREFVEGALCNYDRPPDAYAAVAFWFDPGNAGRPAHVANFLTEHDAIPAPVLVRLAGPYLIDEHAAHLGATEAVERLGYEMEDWSPDDVG